MAVDCAAVDSIEEIAQQASRAVRGSKITGTFWVGTLRGFSRRRARSAARLPTSSGLSRRETSRAEVLQ